MAVRFDAAGEHYTGALSLGTVTQFTLTCWVNFVVDRGTFHGPWQIGNDAGTDYISLATQSTTSTLTVWDEGSNRTNLTSSMGFNEWRFCAVNVNGATGQGYTRLANATALTASSSWSGASASTVIDRIVLGYGEGTGDWLNGCVQDVKLYNGVNLTEAELLALSWRMKPFRWADLAGWWPLYDADGSDHSGNGRHLTGGPNTTGQTPSWAGTGTVFSGTTSATGSLPSGHTLDDIIMCFLESAAGDSPTVAGFSHVTGSPVVQGSGTAGTKLSVMWKRHDGSESNPAVTNTSGNHVIGRMGLVRGARNTGDPWNGTPQTGTDATSDTSGSMSGYTTSADKCLVVMAASGDLPDANGTAEYPVFTNANLTSIAERIDNSATAGNGGALGVDTGVLATAGDIGTTTYTKSNAALKAHLVIAFDASPFDPSVAWESGPPLTWSGESAGPILVAGGGVVEHLAAAALAVTATLAAAATKETMPAAALAASAALAAGATVTKPVAAGLSATATLAAGATVSKPVSAPLAVSASLTAAAAVSKPVTAALAASASLAAGATAEKPVAAALAVTATLAAEASTAAVHEAAAALVVTATLTAAATREQPASATLAVSATLAGAAAREAMAAAALAVTGTLTAGTVEEKPVAAALAVTATLAADLTKQGIQEIAAALAVSATLAAGGTVTKPVAAALAGTAALAADVAVIKPVTAPALVVVATLAAGAVRERNAAATLAVTGTLVAAGARTAVGGAALPVTVTLAAATTGVLAAAAALAATAALVATIGITAAYEPAYVTVDGGAVSGGGVDGSAQAGDLAGAARAGTVDGAARAGVVEGRPAVTGLPG